MRVCEFNGCEARLRRDNQIGYCREHRYSSSAYKQADVERNQDPLRRATRNRQASDWKKQNRDKVNAAWRLWKANNREAYKVISRKRNVNRRARELGQFVEVVDLKVVWERDKGICCLCGLKADVNDWWLEHLIPLSRGGTHQYSNVGVSHPPCNRLKHTKLLSEFLML